MSQARFRPATALLLALVWFVPLATSSGCDEKKHVISSPTGGIVGGNNQPRSEAFFSPTFDGEGEKGSLPSESRTPQAPSIEEAIIRDSVVPINEGGMVLDAKFVDTSADVSELLLKVEGEEGYLVYEVTGVSGRTNGIIVLHVGIKLSVTASQIRLTIALRDQGNRVSNHVDLVVTLVPNRADDLELPSCFSGSFPPSLLGDWRFTYRITELPPSVPSDVRHALMNSIITEDISITGTFDKVQLSYLGNHPLAGRAFPAVITGSHNRFSLGHVMEGNPVPDAPIVCDWRIAQITCGIIECGEIAGEATLIILDLTGGSQCEQLKPAANAFKMKTTFTATLIGPDPCADPEKIEKLALQPELLEQEFDPEAIAELDELVHSTTTISTPTASGPNAFDLVLQATDTDTATDTQED